MIVYNKHLSIIIKKSRFVVLKIPFSKHATRKTRTIFPRFEHDNCGAGFICSLQGRKLMILFTRPLIYSIVLSTGVQLALMEKQEMVLEF